MFYYFLVIPIPHEFVSGTVRGIAPAVIVEHNYSAASRSTRKTFAKGTQYYYYLVTKTHMVL